MRVMWSLVVLLGASTASAQTTRVVDVRRIGSNCEDLTYVDKGPLKQRVVFLDGDELRSAPLDGSAPARVDANLRDTGVVSDWEPRGIAFVDTEKHFVVVDLDDTLVFFGPDGALDRRVAITYPPGFSFGSMEGMDYVPATSAVFPNTIAMLVNDADFRATIVFLGLDGSFVGQIVPDSPVGDGYGLGVAYAATPDRFLVTRYDTDELWAVTLAGTVTGPLAAPVHGPEGIDLTTGKKSVVGNYTGSLVELDKLYAVTASREVGIAPNVSRPFFLDHDDGQFYFQQLLDPPELSSMTDDASTRDPLAVLSGFGSWAGVASLTGTGQVGLLDSTGQQLRVFDTVARVELAPIDLSGVVTPGAFPGRIAFAPTTGTFYIAEIGPGADRTLLHEVEFDGVTVRTIDLGITLGIDRIASVSWRAPGELVVLSGGLLYLADLDGNSQGAFTVPPYLSAVAAINDGPYAGQLAAVSSDSSRLYRLELAAEVLDVRRIGSNCEDLTYVDKGPLKQRVAFLDGDELRSAPLDGSAPARVDANLRDTSVIGDWEPRGIAFVGTEKHFVFVDLDDTLVFFGPDGALDRRVAITYPPGFSFGSMEGMDYVPATSAVFPNTIAMLVNDADFRATIVFLGLDGSFVGQIVPDSPVGDGYGLGVAYAATPDRFLVTRYDTDELWAVTLSGTVTGPLAAPVHGPEGIDRTTGKNSVVGNYTGTVVELDRFYAVTASREVGIAPNVSRPLFLDHDDGQFLFQQLLDPPELSAMSDDATTRDPLAVLSGFYSWSGVASITGAGQVGMLDSTGEQLRVFDTVARVELAPIDLAGVVTPGAFPGRVAFAPTSGTFYIAEIGPGADRTLLHEVGFDGVTVRTIDLGITLGIHAIRSVSWRDPDQLVVLADDLLFLTDLDGVSPGAFTVPPYLSAVAAINDGPHAGQLAAVSSDSSRFYRLAVP